MSLPLPQPLLPLLPRPSTASLTLMSAPLPSVEAGNAIENGTSVALVPLTGTFQLLCELLGAGVDNLSTATVASILQEITPTTEEVEPYLQFERSIYQRVLVKRTEQFELLVICWLPQQVSPVHDHKGSKCWVKILLGTGSEVQLKMNGDQIAVPHSIAHGEVGTLMYAEDEDLHIFGNFSATPLVTLHCYAPPQTSAKIYPEAHSFIPSLQAPYEERRRLDLKD